MPISMSPAESERVRTETIKRALKRAYLEGWHRGHQEACEPGMFPMDSHRDWEQSETLKTFTAGENNG